MSKVVALLLLVAQLGELSNAPKKATFTVVDLSVPSSTRSCIAYKEPLTVNSKREPLASNHPDSLAKQKCPPIEAQKE